MVLENIDKSLTAVGSKVELNLNLDIWRKKRGLESHQRWNPSDIEFICQSVRQADKKGEMIKSIEHGDCETTRGHAYTVIVAHPRPSAKRFTEWLQVQVEAGIDTLNKASHG